MDQEGVALVTGGVAWVDGGLVFLELGGNFGEKWKRPWNKAKFREEVSDLTNDFTQ